MKRLLATPILLVATAASAAAPGARATFDALATLAGDWHSTTGATTVHYEVIANGTTVVESWTMSPTRKSMTVYTMDGERLLATHYCPQGNAPRMQYTGTDASGAAHFLFVDGANLQDPNGAHEHAFWIRIDGSRITRNETYIANGASYDAAKDVGETETFARL